MRHFKRILLGLLAVLVVVSIVNLTFFGLPDAPPLPAGSKFVDVGGKRIHYVERAGKEPAVVMIHGLPGTWGDWDAVADELKGRRTISIDRPGYAFSSEGYVSFEDQLTIINGFTRRLGLKRPVIVGHSYGGALALMYSFRFAGQYSGIVAVDPAVSSEDIPFVRKAQARFVALLELPVLHQLGALTSSNIIRRSSVAMGGKEAFSPDPVDTDWKERALSLNMRYRDLEAWQREVLDAPRAMRTLVDTLPRIFAPVQIIQGQGDKLVATGSVRAAAAVMPNASLKILPGGHMQPYVHAAEVADAVRRSTLR